MEHYLSVLKQRAEDILAEVAPGVCWSGVWGREREYEDTENSLVDTGLRGAFCKHPFTAEILNLVQKMT